MLFTQVISSFAYMQNLQSYWFENQSTMYKNTRFKSVGIEWPPNLPKSIVSVALMHCGSRQTQQELFEIAKNKNS